MTQNLSPSTSDKPDDLFYDTLSASSQNVEWYDDYKIWYKIY
jgi:hypothetical protein